jgi:hypothetical protein
MQKYRLHQKTHGHSAFGTPVQSRVRPLPMFGWSNPGMKDLLFEHLTGLVENWNLPHAVCRNNLKQITAEHRVEERDARGRVRYRWHHKHRDNHLLDCELMLMTAAVIACLSLAERQANADQRVGVSRSGGC